MHLHVHSNHSLLEGTAPIRALVGRAVEHGMKALALTDTGGMYGAIPFYRAAREAGLKPLVGVYLNGMVVLARDREGYACLCRMVTAHHLHNVENRVEDPLVMHAPVIPSEDPPVILRACEEIRTRRHVAPKSVRRVRKTSHSHSEMGATPAAKRISSQALSEAKDLAHAKVPCFRHCEESSTKQSHDFRPRSSGAEIAPTVRRPSTTPRNDGGPPVLDTPEKFLDPEHVFVLASDSGLMEKLLHSGIRPLAAIAHYGDRASRYRAGKLREFALGHGLRPVAVNPVYFLEPDHAKIHRVLSAIRLNTTVDNLDAADMAPDGAWFRSPKEMAALYEDWPEALSNIEWVSDHCDLELPLGKPLFPESELPAGETPFSYLWKLAFDGVKRRYQPLTPEVTRRLQYELDVIQQLGFAPYFLIVADLVRYARERDIPIVGRGSAANSIVAYALGITRVDPFKYDLYFERFLNLSRTDCPDIDLDICWRRRDDVIDYVYRKYGADRVAMICTFNTFQARSAVREVAKACGMTNEEVGEITRQLPHYHAGDIRTVVQFLPECRSLRVDEEPLKTILAMSEFIDGFPRHLSIHSGGLVIAPGPLTDYVPLQRAAKGIVITQYDMGPVEELGLIKMDLLGHRSLTVIDETVQKIWENRGIRVDVDHLPDPDLLTANLIRSGSTIGCFQIESPAMRALLQNTRADNTDMLIKTLSLVRPGPSGSGMKKRFIARRLGKEETVYLHPALEKVLGDTHGVMLYQEDILKVAHVIAGMTLAEADGLRRAMSKKRSPHAMAKSMKTFLDKAMANGVAAPAAEAIWGLIANFAEYSYCKAHASTYGEISYQCTYLKAHFPGEFLSSVLSNRGGFYHPAVYLDEAKRRGIEVRPPDVNKSRVGYTVEGDAIRVGFVEVRNVSQQTVQAILEARQHGPFRSLAECRRRTGMPYADAETLIQAGAFDGFGQPRPTLVWELKALMRGAPKANGPPDAALFEDEGAPPPLPKLPDYSRKKRTDLEWTALGLTVSTHPLEYYLPLVADETLVLSKDLPAYAGRTVTMLGWLIAERRVGLKGRGCMKFLTLEDPAGVFEAVLFPAVYQRYGHLLDSHGPFLVTGEVQEEDYYCSLVVEHVERTGHRPKSPGTSEITPPKRWIFPQASPDGIAHAD